MEPRAFHAEINGHAAGPDDLRHMATVNYGHFTSMQVRECRTRGLSLHLTRLDVSTQRLFGRSIDVELVRSYIRRALAADDRSATVRVNVFSRGMTVASMNADAECDVLVTVGPARGVPPPPLRLKTFVHQRVMPEIKHVGTFENLYHLREAQRAGFDDALFVDANGGVIEGSTWNIGFFDGSRVWFPDAPMLPGIGMQLLQAALEAHGFEVGKRRISGAQAAAFRSAFTTNSVAAFRPIDAIDSAPVQSDPGFATRALKCAESIPWDTI